MRLCATLCDLLGPAGGHLRSRLSHLIISRSRTCLLHSRVGLSLVGGADPLSGGGAFPSSFGAEEERRLPPKRRREEGTTAQLRCQGRATCPLSFASRTVTWSTRVLPGGVADGLGDRVWRSVVLCNSETSKPTAMTLNAMQFAMTYCSR